MVTTSSICPACSKSGIFSTVKRFRLPAMQNYVLRRAELAQAAQSGQFDLAVCPDCGFAYNTCFDPALLNYDEGYDNSVPSSVMIKYYEEIATYLHEKYTLDNGLVVDIGCGKGTFLKILCEKFARVRGLGIDPSYEGDCHVGRGRVQFIKDFFSEKYIGERPSLIVCRHVLEHISDPASFLRSIHSSLKMFPEIPLFFEVPDTIWIIENNAFWDFSYEHCNYFTSDSLLNTLKLSGFTPHTLRTAFGNQYIWIEVRNTQYNIPRNLDGGIRCMLGKSRYKSVTGSTASACNVDEFTRYSNNELTIIAGIRQKLHDLKKDGWSVAIWGMATKGVVFSFLVDPDRTLIDFCIDANQNKQGCFVPLTGHAIQAPEMLSRLNREPLSIVVMNPNYLFEIRNTCKTLALSPAFMDANGNKV